MVKRSRKGETMLWSLFVPPHPSRSVPYCSLSFVPPLSVIYVIQCSLFSRRSCFDITKPSKAYTRRKKRRERERETV